MKLKTLLIGATFIGALNAPLAHATGVPTFDGAQAVAKLKDFLNWIEEKSLMITDQVNQNAQLVLANTADVRDLAREGRETAQAVRDIINYENWLQEFDWWGKEHIWREDIHKWDEINTEKIVLTYEALLEEIRSMEEVIGSEILEMINFENIDRSHSGSTRFRDILLDMNPENPAYTELVDEYLFDTNGFSEMDAAAINAKIEEWGINDEGLREEMAISLERESNRHAFYRDDVQYASDIQQKVNAWELELQEQAAALNSLGSNSLVASVQALGAINANQSKYMLELLRAQSAMIGSNAKENLATNSDYFNAKNLEARALEREKAMISGK